MLTLSVFSLLGVASGAGDHDCTTSGCPAVCECLEAKCEDTDLACHADPACEEAEECAMKCPCGDVSCALACAAANPSGATTNFLNCYQSNCMSAVGHKVSSSDHDCTTSGCPAVCECLEAKCEDTDLACHADPACEEAEECAMKCPCGDVSCALACAAANPSGATTNFLNCYQSNCMSAVGQKVSSSDHDCTTSGCPAVCECLEAKCEDTDLACHADPACEEAEECAMKCPCGDVSCALACAAANPSGATTNFLNCYQSNCMSAVDHKVSSLDHDCTTSGCPAVCECLEAKCEDTDLACHADPACEEAEECAMKCPCGDVSCALACAAANPSGATTNFLSCYQANCMSSFSVV